MKNKLKLMIIAALMLILVQTVFSLDNNLYVSAKYSKKEVCPCTTLVYKFEVKNIGNYPETFSLSVDKQYSNWATFSINDFILNPLEKTTVYAYLTPECSFYGSYKANFYVKTLNSRLAANIPVEINIKPCYDYEISLKEALNYNYAVSQLKNHTGAYTICENELKVIPVLISNKADYINSYELDLNAPKWAYLDYSYLQLPSDTKALVNIILNAPIGLEGKFTFSLDSSSELGDIKQQNMFNVEVGKCYSPYIAPKEFTIGYESASNDITITNSGSKKATYSLNLEGYDWITLDKSKIVLEAGKSATVKLQTKPGENVRKGKYEIPLTVLVGENNAKYEYELIIRLTAPGVSSKLFTAVKDNIGKVLLYSSLLFLAILVILILALTVKKIKSMPKKEKVKEIKPVVEKKIEIKEEKEVKVKESRKKLTKRQRKAITVILIGIILVWLISMNLYALRNLITFEVPKNVSIVKPIPEPPKEVNATFYEKISETFSFIKLPDFIRVYLPYILVAVVLLAIIIVVLFVIKKKIKFKILKKVEEPKKVKKKEEKKVRVRISKKIIFLTLVGIIILAALVFGVIKLFDYIKLYWIYLAVGAVLLTIAIIVLIFIRKKPIKFRIKKEKVKVKEAKPVVEKKAEKKKTKRKIPIKTLKGLLIGAVIIVILLGAGLYVALNYEEIGIQKAGRNFVENFFAKIKYEMKKTSLNLNITKLIKPKEEEIPGIIFDEKGIPPQKWAKNTAYSLDLSKYFSDPDNDKLNYSSTQPQNISVEIVDNIIKLTPEKDWSGISTIVFIASDGKGGIGRSNNVYLIVQDKKDIVNESKNKLNEIKIKITRVFTDAKDYFLFYLNYIIAGFVVLLVIIIVLSYNKKLVKSNKRKK